MVGSTTEAYKLLSDCGTCGRTGQGWHDAADNPVRPIASRARLVDRPANSELACRRVGHSSNRFRLWIGDTAPSRRCGCTLSRPPDGRYKESVRWAGTGPGGESIVDTQASRTQRNSVLRFGGFPYISNPIRKIFDATQTAPNTDATPIPIDSHTSHHGGGWLDAMRTSIPNELMGGR